VRHPRDFLWQDTANIRDAVLLSESFLVASSLRAGEETPWQMVATVFTQLTNGQLLPRRAFSICPNCQMCKARIINLLLELSLEFLKGQMWQAACGVIGACMRRFMAVA